MRDAWVGVGDQLPLTEKGAQMSDVRSHLSGAERIAEERHRQVALGWSREHDSEEHGEDGSLVRAAIMYCACAMPNQSIGLTDLYWPWPVNADDYGMKADPIRSLEKAGALIAAEIDRLSAVGVSEYSPNTETKP